MKFLLVILFFPLLLHAESYSFSGGKNSSAHIIASNILQKAYEKAGIQIKPLYNNLQTSLQLSNNGKTDGELARIKTITRYAPNLRQVPVSIVSIEAVAFSKNKKLIIDDWKDLNGHKVTIVKGVKFIEAETKAIDKKLAPSIKIALDSLNQGKTDIIVIPKLSGLSGIYKNRYKDIKPVSQPLKKLLLYHFVHKKNSHLIPVITPVLQEMKQSGEIQYIRDNYLYKITENLDNRNK